MDLSLLVCLLFLCGCHFVHHIDAATTGLITQYGGPQDGNNPSVATNGVLAGSCGYGLLDQSEWPNWQAAAIGPSNPLYSGGNQKGCGTCIQITCTSGCSANAAPATVLVTDTCESCASTQVNVQALTFQKYFQTNLALGQITASWQQVPCNPPGNIEIVLSNSRTTLGGYFTITLQQVAGTGVITTVELQSSGSTTWQTMTNSFGAAYQVSNFGSAPLSLRITGQGQTLVASNAITAVADGKYQTQIQFGRSSGTATSTATSGTPPSVPPPIPMARSAPPPVMTLLAVPPPTPTAPVVSPPTPVATQAAPPPRVLTIPPPNLAPPARPPPVASPIPAVTPSPGLIAVIPFSPPPPQTRTPPPPQQSSGPTAMTVLSPPLVSSPVITPVATQQPPPIPVATQQPPPLPIPSQQPPPAPVATQQPPPLPIPPQQPPPIPVATQQPPAAQLPALSSNMTALLPLSTQQLVLKAPVPAPSPMLLTISAPLSSPADMQGAIPIVDPSASPVFVPAAPAPAPKQALSPGPTQAPRIAPTPSPRVESSLRPAPAPSPGSSPASSPNSARQTPAAITSLAPGATALTASTGLNGTQLDAANRVVNPEFVASAGRKLLSSSAEV